jgi:hypothetical protein
MRRFAFAGAGIVALALSPGAMAATAPSGKYQTKVPSGQLKGTWTINFVKPGSYNVSGPFPGTVHGKDTISGSTLTLNHESGGSDCKGPGKYKFKLSGKTLTLTKISDSCASRATVTSHKLIKVG